MNKIIRFRPHHLLCFLTYMGKGYSDKFTANFDALIDEINKGKVTIEIVDVPDDICAPRLCDESDDICHCYDKSITERDNTVLADLKYAYGDKIHLTKDLIEKLRHDYKAGTIRAACIGCEWKELCDGIAEENFKGTKLK